MNRLVIAAAVALAGLTTVAIAQSPISQRQTLLKEVGAATREPGLMMRGEMPVDIAKVQASLAVISRHAKVLPTLFPNGSFTGETAALPKIEAERAQFDTIWRQLDTAATAAATSVTAENFRATMGGVLRNCGQCHDAYRRPRT
ncbi:MAG: cytochrome c [Alphaproteobacteria bacterium]